MTEIPSFLDRKSSPLIVCTGAYALAILVAILVGAQIDASPLVIAFWGNIAATVVIFIAGTLFKNTSLYDPYWSLQPPALAIYWLLAAPTYGFSWRAGVLTFLVAFWAYRLTFNCFRRWHNMRHEDFRYTDFRKSWGAFYPIIDFFGLMLFPTLLVFIASVPIYYVITEGAQSWNVYDVLAFNVIVVAIAIELIADEQLHEFLSTNTDPDKVLTTGLWSWSRHPNYVGEILFWWGVFLFALGANQERWQLGLGALLITLLFVFASVPMMQKRKRARRPTYEEQVKGISVLIPRPRRKS